MIRIHRANKPVNGFSLIEVLIAVVVLATGLLALASLQGSLSRNSAEAKVRSRVAGLLSARMDALRVQGYSAIAGNIAAFNVTQNCVAGAPVDLCAAMKQSGLGALELVQAAQIYSSDINAATFAPSSLPTDATKPQFVRINLAATWSDASNSPHRLAAVSEMSELAWNSNLLPNEDPDSSQSVAPIVRQDNPYEEGMIPIAIGGGSDTAATNPKPIVVGTDSAIKETDYNVLTYHNDNASTVRVQQRVETRVVGCKCGFSASAPTGFVVLDRSYRPTYWDGNQYKTPEVASFAKSGAVAWPTSDTQADICTQCCRDHHDPTTIAADKPKFDPVRWNADSTEAQNRFLSTNLTTPVSTSNGVYNDACRVIRVDGLWRVATDAYAVQVGYLATDEADSARDSLLRANTRILDKDYSAKYEDFVTDYLADRFVQPDGLSLSTRYGTKWSLDTPDDIGIKGSTAAGDERYLHTRGLYVDYIEPNTEQRIDDAIENCTVTPTTTKTQCAMQHIPFTSINLTQLAAIVPEKILAGDMVITAATDQINLGKINGVAGRTGASNAVVTAKVSNTGLIGTLPVDSADSDSDPLTLEGDRITFSDQQKFTILTTGGASSPFSVYLNLDTYRITDGPGPNNPDVNWFTSTGNTGCSKNWDDATGPNSYNCVPDATGTAVVDLQVSRYHSESSDSPAVTCTNQPSDSSPALTVAVSPTPRPVCKRYKVDTVAVSAGGGSVVTLPSVTGNLNKYSETTVTKLSLILPSNPNVTVNFIPDPAGDLPATQGECTYLPDGAGGWFVAAVAWTDQCK